MDLLSTLCVFPTFAHVPKEQLRWFVDRAEEHQFLEQITIAQPGKAINYLIVLLEGRIRIDAGAADDIVVYDMPGGIFGILPYSRMKEATFPLIADADTRVLQLHRDHLRDMSEHCYELTEIMVRQMPDEKKSKSEQS